MRNGHIALIALIALILGYDCTITVEKTEGTMLLALWIALLIAPAVVAYATRRAEGLRLLLLLAASVLALYVAVIVTQPGTPESLHQIRVALYLLIIAAPIFAVTRWKTRQSLKQTTTPPSTAPPA